MNRVIAAYINDGTVKVDESGYLVFWPHENLGPLDAATLRIIANELDRRNQPWNDRVYFDLARCQATCTAGPGGIYSIIDILPRLKRGGF